ncbi:uncharacterized protein G2W53_026613 [Senna tora]|uniref:Uncharacterized protein n=1 Tax=Senna tora TaxID=362788 RepID=A0A834TFB6_9FABA|nr:uncharacterized protein G2W53_026613 [Senna tora]
MILSIVPLAVIATYHPADGNSISVRTVAATVLEKIANVLLAYMLAIVNFSITFANILSSISFTYNELRLLTTSEPGKRGLHFVLPFFYLFFFLNTKIFNGEAYTKDFKGTSSHTSGHW